MELKRISFDDAFLSYVLRHFGYLHGTNASQNGP